MQNSKRDYYEVMGLTPAANKDEIKAAFRKLSKEKHPDIYQKELLEYRDGQQKLGRTPSAVTERTLQDRIDEATVEIQIINEAYQTLFNESLRAEYDLYWSATYGPNAGPQFELSTEMLDFGEVPLGQVVVKSFVVNLSSGSADTVTAGLRSSDWIDVEGNSIIGSGGFPLECVVTINTTSIGAGTKAGEVEFYTATQTYMVNVKIEVITVDSDVFTPDDDFIPSIPDPVFTPAPNASTFTPQPVTTPAPSTAATRDTPVATAPVKTPKSFWRRRWTWVGVVLMVIFLATRVEPMYQSFQDTNNFQRLCDLILVAIDPRPEEGQWIIYVMKSEDLARTKVGATLSINGVLERYDFIGVRSENADYSSIELSKISTVTLESARYLTDQGTDKEISCKSMPIYQADGG